VPVKPEICRRLGVETDCIMFMVAAIVDRA
jgi:hypothetical protein